MSFRTLTLKKGKEKSLDRKHPWVFSGAFKSIPNDIAEGELVIIEDFKETFQAQGFFHDGSITVKILSFEQENDIEKVISDKLKAAIRYRENLPATKAQDTNCYRLIFGEGDQLPGLIVDRYGKTAVIQIHHLGWESYLEHIANIIIENTAVENIYSKPNEKITLAKEHIGYLKGQEDLEEVQEHGNSFSIDWVKGQKTGFFIDQRENRYKLAQFSKGKTVLNTFSYSGGFSIYALKAGAEKVVSVDISQSAIDLANKNAVLNQVEDKHEGVADDVFEYLKNEAQNFDIIILDPPAFSKNRRTVHNAVQAYKRLNRLAFKNTKPGGLVFTFSCSQHISPKLFEDTIRAAAIEAKRDIKIVEKLNQPADHPINIFFPEGEYLKGLILKID